MLRCGSEAGYCGTGPMIGAANGVASARELTGGGGAAVNSVPKLADTLVSPFRVTVQLLAIPLHAPPQPARPHPPAGVAVNVT